MAWYSLIRARIRDTHSGSTIWMNMKYARMQGLKQVSQLNYIATLCKKSYWQANCTETLTSFFTLFYQYHANVLHMRLKLIFRGFK